LHDNVRMRPPSGRFIVLSSGSADTDISATSQTVDSATAMNVYVPNWNVTNNARVDNPVICHRFLGHVTLSSYWVALRNQCDVGFLDDFNINYVQHICMVSELHLRYEHEIITREKFEQKFTDSVAKLESEATKVEELRKRVSDLEAMVVVKVGEATSLTTQNAGLLEKDAAERHFAERAAELDARIADVRRDIYNDLYSHMLTAIAGRRWVVGHGFRLAIYKCARSVECRSALGKVISMAINKGIQQGLEVGVVHGKAGRSLAQIEAYDPEVEGKYVAAVSKFKGVSFPLLDELESLKDSHIALIMFTLTLKDDQGETFRFAPSHNSSLGVTDYQVSTLVLSGDGRPTNPLPVVQQHNDLFDTSVLDKSGDV
ncbi:hypothetical protein Tco_0987655, partial [Tanacetum coccineum]